MNILFVCTGNTCRSPMAAFLMQEAAHARGLEMSVRSAGLSATEGSPISRGTADQLRHHCQNSDQMERIDAFIDTHRATRLTDALVDWADLILTMTSSHRSLIQELYPMAGDKVMTLWGAADASRADFDVSDPYGGDRFVYEATYEELLDLIARIMDRM